MGPEEDIPTRLCNSYGTDTKAFEALVRGHYPLLKAIAARELQEYADDAEDIVSSVFVNLRDYLAQGNRIDKFRPFLVVATQNKARTELQGRRAAAKRARRYGGFMLLHGQTDRESEREQSEFQVRLAAEVANLPESQRRVVFLRLQCGWTFEAIGIELDISSAAARQRFQSAKATLVRRMKSSP
jgi:RNA polymerase sigma factor (sigma-70 family)